MKSNSETANSTPVVASYKSKEGKLDLTKLKHGDKIRVNFAFSPNLSDNTSFGGLNVEDNAIETFTEYKTPITDTVRETYTFVSKNPDTGETQLLTIDQITPSEMTPNKLEMRIERKDIYSTEVYTVCIKEMTETYFIMDVYSTVSLEDGVEITLD